MSSILSGLRASAVIAYAVLLATPTLAGSVCQPGQMGKWSNLPLQCMDGLLTDGRKSCRHVVVPGTRHPGGVVPALQRLLDDARVRTHRGERFDAGQIPALRRRVRRRAQPRVRHLRWQPQVSRVAVASPSG